MFPIHFLGHKHELFLCPETSNVMKNVLGIRIPFCICQHYKSGVGF